MTDLRDLCARMADELDHYRQLLMDDRSEVHALAAEARAVLAEPEPEGPTDEQLLAAYARAAYERALTAVVDDTPKPWPDDLVNRAQIAGLRAVLARWGK